MSQSFNVMALKRIKPKSWSFEPPVAERMPCNKEARFLRHRWLGRGLGVSVGLGLLGCSQVSVAELEATTETTPTTEAASELGTRESDVQSIVAELLAIGPRPAGTVEAEQASQYLQTTYEQLGYETRVESFTYDKFLDKGSDLRLSRAAEGLHLEGHALRDSPEGTVQAQLVAISGVGQPEDFAAADVAGAIAIVQRGDITFLEKTENAIAAGAVGLIIVNTEADNFFGTLGEAVSIPVLSLSGEDGETLRNQLQGSLEGELTVDIEFKRVTGRNVVAHRTGVTQPQLIIGGHYDSVTDSPGANDNASGTAAVLNLAKQLADTPMGESVWFVAFDGEEDGLHGSKAFVREAQADFLSGLTAMINFDMVGVNDGLEIGGTESLTAQLTEVPGQFNLGSASGGSDHVPFASAEVPVLFFTRGLDPNYHQPTDQTVSLQLIEDTVQTGLSVVEELLSGASPP